MKSNNLIKNIGKRQKIIKKKQEKSMKIYKINNNKIMINQSKNLDRNQKNRYRKLIIIIKRWKINLKSYWNRQLKKLNKIMMLWIKSQMKNIISLRKNLNQIMN